MSEAFIQTVTVEESAAGQFVQDLQSGRHRLLADEPVELGGDDEGPNPYEYVLMALGACTNMTLRMYAGMKKLPLDAVATTLSLKHVHAEDCADCASKSGTIVEITRDIRIEGELDAAQRQRLLEIADRCPVHRLLSGEVKIRSQVF